MRSVALLLFATLPSSSADIAALGRASAAVQDGLSEATLGKAIKELKRAEEACSADASGVEEGRVISHVRKGYEALLTRLSAAPVDMKKLRKSIEIKQKKKNAAENEATDDEELVSKAEKAAKDAKLSKAKDALEKAEAALEAAKQAASAKEPRPANLFPRLSTIAARMPSTVAKGAKVHVVSESPAVVTVDDWLSEPVTALLKQLYAAFEMAMPTELAADATVDASTVLLPKEISGLKGQRDYTDSSPANPSLCLPQDSEIYGNPIPEFLKKVEEVMTRAKQAQKAGEEACAATAGLVEEAPEDWDVEEDGQWLGQFNSVADRFPAGAQYACGPLTFGLDAALVQSDAAWITASTDKSVDVIDMAVAAALGMPNEPDKILQALVDGATDRPDPEAVQPDTWDEDEDGPWEAPVLTGQDLPTLLKTILTAPGFNRTGLSDSYAFSASPQLVRYRATNKGYDGLSHPCDDFERARSAGDPPPVLVAYLFASDPSADGGGVISVPAAGKRSKGVSVQPKLGRLVLVETALPDGSCDPASALALSALKPSSRDLLLLKKTYFATREHARDTNNFEGPNLITPLVLCKPEFHGCRRFGHVGASKGDTVMELRESKKARACLAAGAFGPCIDPDYSPPPPKPKKKKPVDLPPVDPPPPKQEPKAAAPSGPQAPPPIER